MEKFYGICISKYRFDIFEINIVNKIEKNCV